MPNKVRWGVLGVAGIAVKKVIPAMQKSGVTEIAAIASRDGARAQQAAAALGIEKAYGSYEALLADPDIDAIYNPLPNHLHVPWSIRAADAGKHVLCEKPISLTAAEAMELIKARNRNGVKIGEAFMVHSHPQWLRARQIVESGEIGDLRSIISSFSYSNRDPKNIRNIPEYGGGAIMDIGCYPITMSRFLFREEPRRVLGLLERDPEMGTDRLSSAILEFPFGQSIFTCSTQLVPWQRVNAMGTKGRIELPIPFNAPPDRPTELFVDTGADLFGAGLRREEFPVCDQYTIQGDLFSRAIREGGEVPSSIEDGIWNMAVIEAVFRSAHSGHWEAPAALV
jgi:Predicted dehydrogenases and related proteins